MTEKQAKQLYESKFWENMTMVERVKFQLFESRLCMPFSIFHEAIEKTLKRPVFIHEFASVEYLRKEFLGEAKPPTLDEIANLIPKEKRLILFKK